jgi:hypothetical protein
VFLRTVSLPLVLLPLLAQTDFLRVAPPQTLSGKRGEPVQLKTQLQLANGYHLNSHKPGDPYLIPLKITWDTNVVDTVSVDFPEPRLEKYEFADKPLSVFTGDFIVTSTVRPKNAGFTVLNGKVRYQACSKTMCFPPKTVDIKVPADFR